LFETNLLDLNWEATELNYSILGLYHWNELFE